MSNISSFLSSSTSIPALNGPGSNGYLKRKMWFHNGAYSWTAPKTGKIKICAVGGGAGGNEYPGAGGGMSIGEFDITAANVVSVTVGAGGTGNTGTNATTAGGTTTVVCAAASISITANGGSSHTSGAGTGGTASGGDLNHSGGDGYALVERGGASSGTPWGNGNSASSNMFGGNGWSDTSGITVNTYGGGGSHGVPIPSQNGGSGGKGLISNGGQKLDYGTNDLTTSDSLNGESQPWWDIQDMDGGGGGYANNANNSGGFGGVGSGGGAGTLYGGSGGIGGGGGAGNTYAGNGGPGGGAGGGYSGRSKGGDGFVIIWFEESA